MGPRQTYPVVSLSSPIVGTRYGLRRETPFEGSNPPPAIMTNTNTFWKLQNYIAEMERPHKEELINLKAEHNQLEAHFRCPHSDEHSAHTLSEHTQEESHARHPVNT